MCLDLQHWSYRSDRIRIHNPGAWQTKYFLDQVVNIFLNPLISMAPFFDRFGWNFQGLLAIFQTRIYLFIFWRKQIFLWSYWGFQIFQCFCRMNTTFYFSTDFYYFLLLFSCCPAELESVGIFEISLSVFELCQTFFSSSFFRKLFLT